MIQKPSVTSGTLLSLIGCALGMIFHGILFVDVSRGHSSAADWMIARGSVRLCPTVSMTDKQVGDRLLAFGGIRRARAQRLQRAVDRLVDGVPIGGGARLQSGLGIVPLGLEILDPGLGAGEVALVDQCGDIDDDGAERRQVAELR